ncbi:MAG TPA: NADH-quinone oxidoreductase subunit M [Gammaproteobacteria bacterium]
MDALPLLTLLILLPPFGAVLMVAVWRPASARWVALLTLGAELAVALGVVAGFEPGVAGFQWVERRYWIPSLNVDYMVGVDGVSLLFLPLTVLLFLGIVIASWNAVRTMPRLYFALLLVQLSATLGIFIAIDTLLFFLFWELSLLPLYFLVSLWGVGPERRHAANKYTLIMLSGGVPLLFGFLLLAFNHATSAGVAIHQGLAFDLPTLLATPLADELGIAVFLLLFLGFAVKTPLFPFHSWLPLMAMEGPVAIVATLTGLKLGAYGLLRFAVPLAPQAAQELYWLLIGLATIGILYGAVAALAQTNLRRMLAYSSMSHVGLVVLGIASFNLQGVQGAVLQLLNFTLVAGGSFLLLAMLRQRTGSTDIADLGGVVHSMPLLAALFLLLGLAGMGVPGTSGFPAELLLLLSILQSHTGAGLAALFGMVVGAGYFLSRYRQAFLGPARNPALLHGSDLLARERWLMVLLVLLVVAVGFAPGWLIDLITPAAQAWVARLG